MDKQINNLSHIRKINININLSDEFFDKENNYTNYISAYESFFLSLKQYGFGEIRTMKEDDSNKGIYFGNQEKIIFNIENIEYQYFNVFKKIINCAKDILNRRVGIIVIIEKSYLDNIRLKELNISQIIINDNDTNNNNSKLNYWKNMFKENNILFLEFDDNLNKIYGISNNIDMISIQFLNKTNNSNRYLNICPEPEFYINISNNGDIVSCSVNSINQDKNYVFGNIYKDFIIDVYNSDKFTTFIDKMKNNDYEYLKHCNNCENRCKRYTDIFSLLVLPD